MAWLADIEKMISYCSVNAVKAAQQQKGCFENSNENPRIGKSQAPRDRESSRNYLEGRPHW